MEVNGSDLINALLNMLNENQIDRPSLNNHLDKILKRMTNYKKGDILDPDSKIRLKHDKEFISKIIADEKTEKVPKKDQIKEKMDKIGKYVKSTEKN